MDKKRLGPGVVARAKHGCCSRSQQSSYQGCQLRTPQDSGREALRAGDRVGVADESFDQGLNLGDRYAEVPAACVLFLGGPRANNKLMLNGIVVSRDPEKDKYLLW